MCNPPSIDWSWGSSVQFDGAAGTCMHHTDSPRGVATSDHYCFLHTQGALSFCSEQSSNSRFPEVSVSTYAEKLVSDWPNTADDCVRRAAEQCTDDECNFWEFAPITAASSDIRVKPHAGVLSAWLSSQQRMSYTPSGFPCLQTRTLSGSGRAVRETRSGASPLNCWLQGCHSSASSVK